MSDSKEAPPRPSEPATKPDPTSKLSEAHRKKVNAWFEKRVKPNKGAGCPICGTQHWSVLDDFVTPPNFAPNGGMLLGGEMYPHFMLVCNTCSTIQFINAVQAGVLDRESK